MKRFLASALCAALGLSMVLSGCSPSGGGKGGDGSGGDRVVVGLSIPITGNSAEYGEQFKTAAEITQEKINAAGGINGKTLEFKIMDSKNDAKESCDIARVMVEDKDVIAVIGDFSSTCSMAAAPIYQEAGLLMVSPSTSHVDYAPIGDYIFGTMAMQADESAFMAKSTIVKTLGYDSTAVIYINNDWGVLAIDAFQTAADETGLEITATESFVGGETDFKTVLTKMRQTNPQCLSVFGQYTEASSITKQVHEMGWDVPIIVAGSSCTDQFIQLAGEESEGIYSQAPFFFEDDNEEQMAFYKEFESRTGFPPTIFACIMQDTVEMMSLAIAKAEGTGREEVRNAFRDYEGYSGLMGEIRFTEEGYVIRDFRVAAIENGKWVPKTDYGEA